MTKREIAIANMILTRQGYMTFTIKEGKTVFKLTPAAYAFVGVKIPSKKEKTK